jgi:hypothetical protein
MRSDLRTALVVIEVLALRPVPLSLFSYVPSFAISFNFSTAASANP